MERKLIVNKDMQLIVQELSNEDVGAALRGWLFDAPTEGMQRALCNMFKSKEKFEKKLPPSPTMWLYKEVQPIFESPFGDGRLHRMCIDYHTLHKSEIKPEVYKEFLSYWTAQVQNGLKSGKERWTCEKTFSLGNRLATWVKNNKNWGAKEKEDYLQKTANDLNKLFK